MSSTWLHNLHLIDPEAVAARPAAVLVESGRIRALGGAADPAPEGAAPVDLGGARLAPGFLDLHHHGSAIFASEGASSIQAAVRHDAELLTRHGTTGFLVTTVAWEPARLAGFVTRAASACGDAPQDAAAPLGLHLEGPWISPEAAGAQPGTGIRPYARVEADALFAAGEGLVRMVTLAPEVPGAPELQEDLERRGVVGALGHSMTQEPDAIRVIERGARHVTHLFNAMSGLHHRAPGLVGLGLTDERLTCDLICDGAHVEPRVVGLAARALGERLVLISDRVDPPEGADFGAGPLRRGERAIHLEGGRLAGSALTLDRAVANLRSFAGADLVEAVAACTVRPARLLGLEAERGTLRPGARADFALLDPDGGVRATWIAGRQVWERGAP